MHLVSDDRLAYDGLSGRNDLEETMSEEKCIFGHLHDWRHLEQHAEYVNSDTPEEEVVTHDEWYCTRCRRIEKTERERIKTADR